MKIFQNKNLFKKLMIIFLVITIFSFCMPKAVRADDSIGGKLLNPIMSFFVAIGDGTMTLIQKMVLQMDESLIPINDSSGFLSKVIVIIVTVAVISVIIAATVIGAVGATGAAIAMTIIKGGITVFAIGTVATVTFPITTTIVEGMLPNKFQLPIFVVTPQEIFSNKIPLLDVDFFNPNDEIIKVDNTKDLVKKESMGSKYEYTNKYLVDNCGYDRSHSMTETFTESNGIAQSPNKYTQNKWNYNGKVYTYCYSSSGSWFCTRFDANTQGENWEWLNFDSTENGGIKYKWDTNVATAIWDDGAGEVYENVVTTTTGSVDEITSIAKELQSTVANWYRILRDISLVTLLSVLVYIGIRIIISSTSNDKAKYKQMLWDWVVAICLLFTMQYIMSFSNFAVKKVIDIVDTTRVDADQETNVTEPEVFVIEDVKKAKKAYEVLVGDENTDENKYAEYFLDSNNQRATSKNDVAKLAWPAENFMQQARIRLQLLEDDNDTYVAIGWKLIYVVLVIYTVIFVFTYVKRVVYMAFLTIIAPLVALTYPIDKMNDGKAQAFDAWFKEYIFNLLIQPMHLILYTILIGSAMNFVSKNIIYVVVALGFMTPAEKLLRRFFGFEKAHTPGLLGGPAGAAIMMTGMNKLLGKQAGSKSSSSSSGSNGGSSDDENDSKGLRFNKDFDKVDSMLGGPSVENGKILGENNVKTKMPKPEPKNDIPKDTQTRKAVNTNGNNVSTTGKGNSSSKINPSNEDKDVKNKKKVKFRDTPFGRGARYYANKKLTKLGEKIRNSHPARTGLKLYGGLAAGTAGAILGGIAGGDPNKAFQYGVTGAVSGYKAMDGILPEFENDEDLNNAIELGKETYYGDEYDDKKSEEYAKKFKHNYDNQVKLESLLGSQEEAKEFMNNESEYYIKNGITNIEDMVIAKEMIDDEIVTDRDMAISTVKYAKRVGSKPKDMKTKDQEEWRTTFINEFNRNDRVKQNLFNAEEETDKVMNRINAYYDKKSK